MTQWPYLAFFYSKYWVNLTVRYFWHGFIHRVQHLCAFNIVAPLFITFCQMYGRRRTLSTRPSLLMFRIDRPIARISSSRVVPGPSQWFFHFGEEITIAWSHIGGVRWMLQNLPLPETQEVRDNSGSVIPWIVMKNNEVLYHQVSSFSPVSWNGHNNSTNWNINGCWNAIWEDGLKLNHDFFYV